jgi:hypothetical protein
MISDTVSKRYGKNMYKRRRYLRYVKKHSQPSALQSTCEHDRLVCMRYKRSVSKVFRSPKMGQCVLQFTRPTFRNSLRPSTMQGTKRSIAHAVFCLVYTLKRMCRVSHRL